MNDRSSSVKTNRIALNTVLLYGRMFIVMTINLYTVRLALKALGIEDYGIYNVVAGIVTMLQSFSAVMATATQRYYSYSMGEDAYGKLKKIFSTSLNIYAFFSVIVLLLGETIGIWLLNTQLVIPYNRIAAANWVYQFSLLSFIITMFATPFSSAIIAHEDMNVFAYISVVECVLKFMVAVLLPYFMYDRLTIYGASFVGIALICFICYFKICRRRYKECYYERGTDLNLYKELLSFLGWSLLSSFAGVGMNQVCNIFTNMFFGPVVNASRAIAFQINGAMSSFTGGFLMAIRPPMIKAYAEQSYHYLNRMFYFSNKLIYYCLLMVIPPLFLEMDKILTLWLDSTDLQTTLFARLILIYVLIMALNNPISIIVQATGQIKKYNIYVEFFTLLCMPVTYILFWLGLPASSAFVVMIFAAILSHVVRLICLKRYYPQYSHSKYIKSFVLPAMFITVLLFTIVYGAHTHITNDVVRFLAVTVLSVFCTMLFSFMWGLSIEERLYIKTLLFKRVKRMRI